MSRRMAVEKFKAQHGHGRFHLDRMQTAVKAKLTLAVSHMVAMKCCLK